MINNLPFSRKELSTLFTLSAIALLLSSPLLVFNLVVPPVQAQPSATVQTTQPATGTLHCSNTDATLTFEAHENASSGLTSGTFQVASRYGDRPQILYSGNLSSGFGGGTNGGVNLNYTLDKVSNIPPCATKGQTLEMKSSCTGDMTNDIVVEIVDNGNNFGIFQGAVECSSQGGDTTAQQPASSMTRTTSQDRDGDGILDANDNCPNLPNTRCYKERDTALVVHNNNR